MAKSNWDHLLQEIGLVTAPEVVLAEPVIAAPETAPETIVEEKIACAETLPILSAPATEISPPVSPQISPSPRGKVPAFGAGILEDAPENSAPIAPVENFVAASAPSFVEEVRRAESPPVCDLVAAVQATEKKAEAFFDLLPKLSSFERKASPPSMVEETPLPSRLFAAPQKSAPQLSSKTPQLQKVERPPQVKRREMPPTQPIIPPQKTDASHSQKNDAPSAQKFADPWTDVATQVEGIAERKVVEPQTEERQKENRHEKRKERHHKEERKSRPETCQENLRKELRDSREERHHEKREAQQKPAREPRAEPVVMERAAQISSWNDAVKTVVETNLARRRPRR